MSSSRRQSISPTKLRLSLFTHDDDPALTTITSKLFPDTSPQRSITIPHNSKNNKLKHTLKPLKSPLRSQSSTQPFTAREKTTGLTTTPLISRESDAGIDDAVSQWKFTMSEPPAVSKIGRSMSFNYSQAGVSAKRSDGGVIGKNGRLGRMMNSRQMDGADSTDRTGILKFGNAAKSDVSRKHVRIDDDGDNGGVKKAKGDLEENVFLSPSKQRTTNEELRDALKENTKLMVRITENQEHILNCLKKLGTI